MAKFKNVSPLGALEVPALRRIVEPGEVFDVPADLVEYFDGQAGTFAPVKGRGKKTEGEEPADDNEIEDAVGVEAEEAQR